jgi:hypothetical protein
MKRNRNIKQYDKRNSGVYNYLNMICIPCSNYSTLCSPRPSLHLSTLHFHLRLPYFTSLPNPSVCMNQETEFKHPEAPDLPRSTGPPQKHRTSLEAPDLPRSTGHPQKHRTSPEAPNYDAAIHRLWEMRNIRKWWSSYGGGGGCLTVSLCRLYSHLAKIKSWKWYSVKLSSSAERSRA